MRLKKGSSAAKAFMAKLRAAKGKPKKSATKKRKLSKIGSEDKPVQIIYYKDQEIMYEPHYNKYYANDIEFTTLAAAKKYIDRYNKISGMRKKKVIPKKKAAPKKKIATKKSSLHKDTKSHNVRISVVSGIGSIMTHFKDQYGKLAAKKLIEKTKREKNKIAKQMTAIAIKIKKLKNFLA